MMGPALGWWTWGAHPELADRFFGSVPWMTFLFHPALGFSVMLALLLTRTPLSASLLRCTLALAASLPFALGFTVLVGALETLGFKKAQSVPLISLVLFVLPCLMHGLSPRSSLRGERPIILLVALLWHGFFVSRVYFDSDAAKHIEPLRFAVVCVCAFCSLVLMVHVTGNTPNTTTNRSNTKPKSA